MSTKNSRDLLDWLRIYARDKFTSIGYTADASNMNLALTSDTRVVSAINYLFQREVELWASWGPALEPFWQAAQDEVRADIAAMPANVAALWSSLWADPDDNVRRLLKALLRVLTMAVQAVRAAG